MGVICSLLLLLLFSSSAAVLANECEVDMDNADSVGNAGKETGSNLTAAMPVDGLEEYSLFLHSSCSTGPVAVYGGDSEADAALFCIPLCSCEDGLLDAADDDRDVLADDSTDADSDDDVAEKE